MKYRYYIIQKDIYMYTYMSICIYVQQKNTVCHILFCVQHFQWMSNTGWSGTLLCRRIAHVRYVPGAACCVDCSPIVTEKG